MLLRWAIKDEWELTGWNGKRKDVPDKVKSICKGHGEGGSIVYMRGWRKNSMARVQRARQCTLGNAREGLTGARPPRDLWVRKSPKHISQWVFTQWQEKGNTKLQLPLLSHIPENALPLSVKSLGINIICFLLENMFNPQYSTEPN